MKAKLTFLERLIVSSGLLAFVSRRFDLVDGDRVREASAMMSKLLSEACALRAEFMANHQKNMDYISSIDDFLKRVSPEYLQVRAKEDARAAIQKISSGSIKLPASSAAQGDTST